MNLLDSGRVGRLIYPCWVNPVKINNFLQAKLYLKWGERKVHNLSTGFGLLLLFNWLLNGSAKEMPNKKDIPEIRNSVQQSSEWIVWMF